MKSIHSDQELEYRCPSCGEINDILIDPSGGIKQEYTEDCSVCCKPNVLTITILPDGSISVNAEPER